MIVVGKARRQDPALKPALTASQRRLRDTLLEAMLEVRRQVASREGLLLDAIEHKPLDRIPDLIDWTPVEALADTVIAELHADLLDAATRTAEGVAVKKAAPVPFRFDRESPLAAEWARRQGATLIREVSQSVRRAVRAFTEAASLGGMTPRAMARELRNVIGLTEQQASWVSNTYDATLASSLRAGMTEAQAERLAAAAASRQHERLARYRAETIARTEILRAANEGRNMAWAEGVKEGYIPQDSWKRWSATDDDRLCEECSDMDGEEVPLSDDFSTGDPPLHPSCRCSVLLIDNPDIEAEVDQLLSMPQAALDRELAELLAP